MYKRQELGLLKMDFLGLRTLTVIDDAEKMIRKREPGFSMDAVPYDDQRVYAMLNAGETEGVFQMESGGMTQAVMGLQDVYKRQSWSRGTRPRITAAQALRQIRRILWASNCPAR